MKHVKSVTCSLALMTALSWVPSLVLADIVMGIFPRRPAAVSISAFKPLAEHLSKVLGEEVKLVVPKNFKEFWKGVEAKEYDIVHFNQYHYIKSHKELGYNVIAANEEFGDSTIAGMITVRADSGINSIEDLKGKTILFGGGKKAMGSYIAPTAVLKKAGLIEGKDYKAEFATNPPSAVIGVYNKAADASGSGSIILKVKGVTSKIDVAQMKSLAESEPFIHLCWAVGASVPQDKADKIQAAMTSLSNDAEGKAILKSARVTNFLKTSDADFAKVREITKFALDETY